MSLPSIFSHLTTALPFLTQLPALYASMPSMSDYNISDAALKAMPEKERLAQAASASQAAQQAQGLADTLRKKAAVITDPAERNRVLSEAYDREIEAHGNSKKAKLLSSGGFQGAVGGAGIGGAVGVGLGTVVGTVVGTVATIPTTLVGGLVGGGVGALHGPWIKLQKIGKGGVKKEEVVQVPEAAVRSGAVTVNEKTGEATVRDPEALKKASEQTGEAAQTAEESKEQQSGTPKKKPRKLQVRSSAQIQREEQEQKAEQAKTEERKQEKKRKPARKLEVRSNGKAQAA
ncbi:hypothetical protein LTR95_007816 [Oleoguttula sp. CCFEE 5521]